MAGGISIANIQVGLAQEGSAQGTVRSQVRRRICADGHSYCYEFSGLRSPYYITCTGSALLIMRSIMIDWPRQMKNHAIHSYVEIVYILHGICPRYPSSYLWRAYYVMRGNIVHYTWKESDASQ